jgi:dihydroorotate dehydrogenase subfamily 1
MNRKKNYTAMVVKSSYISGESDIFKFILRANSLDKSKVGPEQFFSFRPLNDAPMIRPFSLAWIDDEGLLVFFIKAVGENTRGYSRFEPKTLIEISGPLGKKFELLPGVENYIFVGGGTGGAGLFLPIKMVLDSGKKVEFILGVKNDYDIFGREILKPLGIHPQILSENNSTLHIHGQATDQLKIALEKKVPNTAVIACGPKLMLKKVFDLCSDAGVPCLISVEKLMACGTGSCGGCAIEMADGTFKQVCEDGPIFDAYKIKWEKFLHQPAVTIKSKGEQTAEPLKTILSKPGRRELNLDYPWAIAPGCIGLKEAKNNPELRVGAWHVKGVTLKPRQGNPAPRICESGHGLMLNSDGLTNKGVDRFIEEDFFAWEELKKPVIVQIAGETIDEYGLVAEKFRDVPVRAIDINISCPNLDRGGASFGADPDNVYQIVRAVRRALPHVYLIVKLTPNVNDIVSIANAALSGGADCLAAINTLKGMRIDIKTRRPRLGKNYGGLSGPALLPIGIAATSQIRQSIPGIDIIGVGGISCGSEALEYFLAGANMVEIGTAWFTNGNIFNEIADTITEYLQKNNIAHIQDLSGAVELF